MSRGNKRSTDFTVRRGRTGFNGTALAAMTLTEAKKVFKKYPESVIADVHAEAKARQKELDAEAKKVEANAEAPASEENGK